MSHRESSRRGRGCLAAAVVLPLAAVGGAAVLVLTFGQPAPPSSAQPPVTAHQTLVSVRTAAPPAPLSPFVVVHPTSPRPPGAVRSAEPTPFPERLAGHQPQVPPGTSARNSGPRGRVDLPPTRSFATTATTTTAAEPTGPTTAPPVTTTTPAAPTTPLTTRPTQPAAEPTTAEPTTTAPAPPP
ncbi:hypothetical protein ACQPYE_03695 [Actinosynnema sp. CA-299493]